MAPPKIFGKIEKFSRKAFPKAPQVNIEKISSLGDPPTNVKMLPHLLKFFAHKDWRSTLRSLQKNLIFKNTRITPPRE